jgi:hypothetical protein
MSVASEYVEESVGGSTTCVCVQVDGCERVYGLHLFFSLLTLSVGKVYTIRINKIILSIFEVLSE